MILVRSSSYFLNELTGDNSLEEGARDESVDDSGESGALLTVDIGTFPF